MQPSVPLSPYLTIFQFPFHHCCQYNPPTAPISLISGVLGFGKSRHESRRLSGLCIQHLYPIVCEVGWRGDIFREIGPGHILAAASCKDYVDSATAAVELQNWSNERFKLSLTHRELMIFTNHWSPRDCTFFAQFYQKWTFVKLHGIDIYWYLTSFAEFRAGQMFNFTTNMDMKAFACSSFANFPW